MLFLNRFLAENSETLVRVLGHSLWQSALIAAFVWFSLRQLSARRANLRYGVAVAGLLATVAAVFATWSVIQLPAADLGETATAQSVTAPPAMTPVARAHVGVHSHDHAEEAPVAVELSIPPMPPPASTQNTVAPSALRGTLTQGLSVLWLLGACLMLGRGLLGVATVRSWAKDQKASSSIDLTALEDVLKELAARLKLQRVVRLLVSERVSTPAVIGLMWPTILLPVAMLSEVPAQQWRIIIAHELAHVRRWDAIASLLQMMIESCLFFNPAVWWISRQVRIEREACCDALAAEVCGQPLNVARTLVEVAAAVVTPTMSPALAFAEPSQPSELSDRVMRLVDPDRAARPRVSWTSLIAVVLALTLTGWLLQRGTDIAVRAAAEWMSPKERIEKLVQLEAENNGVIVPLANGPQQALGNDPSVTNKRSDPEDGRIPVHLVIKTDDGTSIGPKLQIHSMSQAGNHSSSSNIDTPREPVAEYRKTVYYMPCRLRIAVMYPDRATEVSPLVMLMPTDKEKTIELVLKSGSPLLVRLQDEQGRPVTKAALRCSTVVTTGNGSSSLHQAEREADEQGVVQLEHLGEGDHQFEIQAAGFQRTQVKRVLDEALLSKTDTPLAIVLRAARPVVVRVIDAKTDQPVKGVRLVIAHRQTAGHSSGYGFTRRWSGPNRWNDYAVSNEQGVAVLDQLEDTGEYTFVAAADNYGLAVFDVRAGASEQIVKLSPPLKIAGKVTGHIERLYEAKKNGKSIRSFSVRMSLGNHYNDSVWAELDDEGRFAVEDLAVGERIDMSLPDERRDFVLKESIEDLQFDIKSVDAPPTLPTRDVVIRLTGTAPEAPARGTLYVSFQHPTARLADFQNGPLQLRNNQIELKIPVGAVLNFSERDLVGYRISDQSNIEIPAGSEPLIIEAPATAAGGIHGAITRADGSPADRAFVHVFATKLPASEKDHSRINPSSKSGSSRFLSRVPIGGRYRVLAYEQTETSYVWAISDEVTIDESNPISQMNIQLAPGSDIKIKLLDPEGRPVPRQQVHLSIGFSLKTMFSSKSSSTGFSTGMNAESDADGVVLLKRVASENAANPVECKLRLRVLPDRFTGEEFEVDSLKPIEVRLKKGLSASGVLIHSATGKPVQNIEVRLHPVDWSKAKYKDSIAMRTDAEGRFRFEALEGIQYRAYLHGAVAKGVVVEAIPGGGHRFHYPNGNPDLLVTPGSDTPIRWEVTPYESRY